MARVFFETIFLSLGHVKRWRDDKLLSRKKKKNNKNMHDKETIKKPFWTFFQGGSTLIIWLD